MRTIQRLILLALIIALGVWLFYIGREHQVFLDNKSVTLGTESGEQSYKALEQVNVSVNGGKTLELIKRDRDLAVVVGPKFTIKVDVLDDIEGEVIQTIEREINIGFEKDTMISLPILSKLTEQGNSSSLDFLLPPPTVAVAPAPEPKPAEPALMEPAI